LARVASPHIAQAVAKKRTESALLFDNAPCHVSASPFAWYSTSVIDTARLHLRLPTAADAQPLLDIHEHPEVVKYVVSGPARRGISGAWNSVATMLGHWHLRGYGQWTAVEKATGEVVGRIGLWNPEGWPGVELGWIVRYSRWGNGFATEASRAVIDWTWRCTDLDHLISIIRTDNVASIRVATKIGETLERDDVVNDAPVGVYGIRRPTRARRRR
jgi:RimJ/RimL family protein N-acetyltransferase